MEGNIWVSICHLERGKLYFNFHFPSGKWKGLFEFSFSIFILDCVLRWLCSGPTTRASQEADRSPSKTLFLKYFTKMEDLEDFLIKFEDLLKNWKMEYPKIFHLEGFGRLEYLESFSSTIPPFWKMWKIEKGIFQILENVENRKRNIGHFFLVCQILLFKLRPDGCRYCKSFFGGCRTS